MTSSSGRSDARVRDARPTADAASPPARTPWWRRIAARLRRDEERARIARYEAGVAHLLAVCTAAARGDLELRAQEIPTLVDADGAALPPDDLLRLASCLNQALDLSDAYVRESRAALEAARDGRFYRRVLERGLLGTYVGGARVINAASASMAATAAAAAQREVEAAAFESRALQIVEAVAATATEANAAADSLSAGARTAADAVAQAAAASGHVTREIAAVAGRGADVARTAEAIAGQAERSLNATITAERAVTDAQTAVRNLDEATHQIDSVLALIQQVAFQTNLLALNAAVEAARAGDAGRGFAVVADEVRSLAGRTAEATRTVEQKIAAVQASTGAVVGQIGHMERQIAECAASARGIAAAVDEQRALTRGMHTSLQGAAEQSSAASRGMDATQVTVEETTAASAQVLAAAEELARTAETLDDALRTFLGSLRREAAALDASTAAPPTVPPHGGGRAAARPGTRAPGAARGAHAVASAR